MTTTMPELQTTSTQNEELHENSDFQPKILNIPDNVSTELLLYGQSKPNIISLAQGDSFLHTPNFICDAAYKAMQEGKTHYGPVLGQAPLKDALAKYYKNILDVDISTNRISVTSSGTTSLHWALNSIVQEDDEVVCITPIWRNIMGIVNLSGGKPVQVPLDYDSNSGWSLDLEKLFAACTSRTKAILIVSPSNPTGWVMNKEEMQAILDFTRQRGLWIVADAVYNRLMYGQKTAPDFMEIAEENDLVYSVNSFSKSWSMTGWRLGWIIGPKQAEPVLSNLALYENMGAPTFNQYGAIAALEQGEEFIEHHKDLWEKNLNILDERFSKNDKIDFVRPDSTFYSFFKVKGENDCTDICRRLIDEAGVSLAPGCSFGDDFSGWIRMCFAVSEEDLIKALDRIEMIIK